MSNQSIKEDIKKEYLEVCTALGDIEVQLKMLLEKKERLLKDQAALDKAVPFLLHIEQKYEAAKTLDLSQENKIIQG
jgi:hypothetical protein